MAPTLVRQAKPLLHPGSQRCFRPAGTRVLKLQSSVIVVQNYGCLVEERNRLIRWTKFAVHVDSSSLRKTAQISADCLPVIAQIVETNTWVVKRWPTTLALDDAIASP